MLRGFSYYVILLLLTVGHVKSHVFRWRYEIDIYDRQNWILEDEEYCEGLAFPKNIPGISLIDQLDVKDILLPQVGEIVLSSNSSIIFNENSTDVMNCVSLNETKFIELSWTLIDNWIMVGQEGNTAVPHIERIPCRFDDVEFPAGLQTRTLSINVYGNKIKSFKFGNDSWTNDDLTVYFQQQVITNIFKAYGDIISILDITGQECGDPTGCICGNSNFMVCYTPPYYIYPEVEQKLDCLDPIKPEGFCIKMCGASITFKPKRHFQMKQFQEKIKQYNSDTYASKVKINDRECIQVVFAEKAFTGASIDEANDLYQRLINDKTLGARQVELQKCGPQYIEGAALRNTLWSIFGTLTGVLLVFGLFYLIFATSYIERIRNRITFGERPISTYKSKYFAKYKTSDVGLIFEGQSLAGSVAHLDRSFENPAYGRVSSSTTSTTDDAGVDTASSFSKVEAVIENPSDGFKDNFHQVENISEQGELIDLSSNRT